MCVLCHRQEIFTVEKDIEFFEKTEDDPEDFLEEYLVEHFDETAVCDSSMICRICTRNAGPFVNALHESVLLDEIKKCLLLKVS